MKNKSTDLWEPKRRIEQQYQKSLNVTVEHIEKLIDGLTDPYEIAELS